MSIAQTISSFTQVPSSHKPHRSSVVRCCSEQFKPSARPTASSLHATDPEVNRTVLTREMRTDRIRNLLRNVEISVSSYDTAWVAMVPSPDSPKSPCFPECLDWLIENQLDDGSWGLLHKDHRLVKDKLSSTLACVIALKQWNVGEDQISEGLQYIKSNFASAIDKDQPSPYGFEIIFARMLDYAKVLNLKLPVKQTDLSLMLHEGESTLKRCHSNEMEAYLAYILEGIGNSYNWNTVKKYQMTNGSFFNSPSATSAVLIKHHNDGCRNYLTSLLNKFGNAVPTAYPIDIYVRLCMVDTLERLGIARYFRVEIVHILDETYRCWVQRDEQIFKDVVTCALAFRILRINGYEVSSDPLTEITKNAGAYMNSLEEPEVKDVYAALEVYRAQHFLYQEELAFGEQSLWAINLLKRITTTASNRFSEFIHKEVENTLEFPINSGLERISTRRNIENYIVDDTRTLKTTYRSSNIGNDDYLQLAIEDFNACQSIYRAELKSLEGWVVDNKLDKLKFARQKTAYCYFSVAATLSSPELSNARISWAKSSILTTVIDDFFDIGGSMDELANLIQCVEKWNINVENDCCSEEVRVIFLALKNAISWIADAAFNLQGRDIKQHVIEVWLDLMNSMMREAIWTKDAFVPTINEYMENAYVSFALGPIVKPALYFLGPKLSEEIIQSDEYHYLYMLMSTQGRLLNDINSFKREFEEGKLNALALRMRHGESGIMKEDVVKEMKTLVSDQRREMMKLVLEAKGSVIPRACKDAFWNMCNVLNFFYAKDDGFTGSAILDIVKEVLYEPVSCHLMPVNGTNEL
ncbi:ent-kaurene synthase 2, chloroplastic-like [Rutidosis leptorrhynchoides]|uniref:ent-kaurene synthase 2, chloroplastic-like n=1 Tax=Rutidosis leptorrhynchoides TaxID=125765 RepID=UPI003A99844C